MLNLILRCIPSAVCSVPAPTSPSFATKLSQLYPARQLFVHQLTPPASATRRTQPATTAKSRSETVSATTPSFDSSLEDSPAPTSSLPQARPQLQAPFPCRRLRAISTRTEASLRFCPAATPRAQPCSQRPTTTRHRRSSSLTLTTATRLTPSRADTTLRPARTTHLVISTTSLYRHLTPLLRLSVRATSRSSSLAILFVCHVS